MFCRGKKSIVDNKNICSNNMGYACHTRYSGWCEQAVKKVILWGKIRFFNRNVGFLKFCRKKNVEENITNIVFLST